MSDTMRELLAFEEWWEKDGQFCRAGGGNYEKTFAFQAWQAAQSQPAPMKLPKLPEPDTTHYAQWDGDRIKYHSVDQIIEFANARVTAALAAARKGKS